MRAVAKKAVCGGRYVTLLLTLSFVSPLVCTCIICCMPQKYSYHTIHHHTSPYNNSTTVQQYNRTRPGTATSTRSGYKEQYLASLVPPSATVLWTACCCYSYCYKFAMMATCVLLLPITSAESTTMEERSRYNNRRIQKKMDIKREQ